MDTFLVGARQGSYCRVGGAFASASVATGRVFRHQPAIGGVDGFQLAVAVLDAAVIKNCFELTISNR